MKVKFKKKTTSGDDRRKSILRAVCVFGLSLMLTASAKAFNPRFTYAEILDKERVTTEVEVATSSENEINDPANHDFTLNEDDDIQESNLETEVSVDTETENNEIPNNENNDETADTNTSDVSIAQDVTNSSVNNIDNNVCDEDSPQTSSDQDTTDDEIADEPQDEDAVVEMMLDLSENEYGILCRIVEAEVTGTASNLAAAKGCSEQDIIECKANVARVIINRVLSSKFPNSVEGVVFQRKQFSPISDGRYYKVSITDDTRRAVDYALNKNSPVDAADCRFFRSDKGTWKKYEFVFRDEVGHKFYR